jgi:uroporphyrinogen-III synthase
MTLSGRHVIITRPVGQAGHLATLLVEQGAHPVFFPVLEIHDCADITPVLEAAIALDTYDLAVFVSPNAIEKALDIILPRRAWPAHVPAIALGKMSEQALMHRGVTRVISPPLRFDSEALLELPELVAAKGKRIIIFRGDSGRELLGETLVARGAKVHHVACYRRLVSKTDPGPLLKRWEAGTLDAVTLTSSEGLRHFFAMIGHLGQAWLKKTPVFVTHQRIATQASALGLTQVIPTPPGDDGLLAELMQYYAHYGTRK